MKRDDDVVELDREHGAARYRAARWASAAAVLAALLLPAGASAARTCSEPTGAWQRAAPQDVGMDPDRLATAVHAMQDRRAYAVRIYRHGCLVATDSNASVNATAQYESWGLTSSFVGLLVQRAITLGVLSPEDPVGALVPEADAAHGAIRVRDLLERSSGLQPAPDRLGSRDRVREALTTPLSQPPGTRFPDHPASASLLAEVLRRALGEELPAFAQRELLTPLGIGASQWRWIRDPAGRVHGSYGMSMAADDLARLGDLLRRGGVWRDQRLLDPGVLGAAMGPSRANACLGWFVWRNAAEDCSGTAHRLIPGAPADMWQLRGRFDQRITVFPALDVEVVRLGTSSADTRSGEDVATWERGIYQALLASITDDEPKLTPNGPAVDTELDFRESSRDLPGLPPPGPARARAVAIVASGRRVSRRRIAVVGFACPQRAARTCVGTATLDGAKRPRRFAAAPGTTAFVRFRLRRRPAAAEPHAVRALAEDAAEGVPTTAEVQLSP